MTEFSVLAQWILNQNKSYQQLLLDLETNKQNCLKITGAGLEFCSRDKKDFEQYLRIYTGQVVEKGFRLCKQMVDQQPNRDPNEVIDECMTLYSMNMEMYEKNVVDKLQSLTEKFSVENL